MLAGSDNSWRDEVSARLNRYRARRRPRAPRYPSLLLKFETPEVRAVAAVEDTPVGVPTATAVITRQAVAMDPVEFEPAPPEIQEPDPGPEAEEPAPSWTTGKILEFPRFPSYAPPPPLSDLADPVIDRPRILEAPEVVPPPPALGGMTIEPPQVEEPERRPGIDMPLQSAPLGSRLLAAAVDWAIVLAACAVFGGIFYRIAGMRPPVWELIGLGTGLPCLLWAGYQYLLMVYCGSTPGLRRARLQLSHFDGTLPTRRTRRWRVLASLLSGVSLGMGYAWQFLDEDALCWHERVTRTFLAPRK